MIYFDIYGMFMPTSYKAGDRMKPSQLMHALRTLNESELFYQRYRQAETDAKSLIAFLSELDMEYVLREHLLIPEIPETIPQEFQEDWFFNADTNQSIYVWKHNCFTPPIQHHHNFFEVFYVLEGSCRHTVGSSDTLLHVGDCCLIQPGIEHSIDVPDTSIVIDILIRKSTFRDHFFDVLRGDNIISSFFLSTLYAQHALDYIIFHSHGDERLRSLISEIYLEFFNKEEYYQELINSLMTFFYAKLLRSYQKTCELPPYHSTDALKAIETIRYIQNNYQNITLSSFAQAQHYSVEHSSRTIKALTGRTFSQLLLQIRMDKACELLRDTNIPVGEIAYQVGYMNPEHFIRKFKQFKTMTPSEYRKTSHKRK